MFNERVITREGVSESSVYLTVMLVILSGTALALATEHLFLGVAGTLLLALISLSYGAVQFADRR